MSDTAHFGNLAAEWWDPIGVSSVLFSYNRIRVPFVVEGLIATDVIPADRLDKPNALEGIKVLDVGCGAGIFTEALAKLKADVVVGLEPCEVLVEAAQKHLKKSKLTNVKYVCETIEKHCEANKDKYDVIVASEVVEHIANESKKSFIEACVKALKPGGSFYITTLNKTIESLVGGKIVGEYVLKDVVPPNAHDWDQFISPDDLRKMLKSFNCVAQEVRGIKYEWWHKYAKWTWYKGISYGLYAVKEKAD